MFNLTFISLKQYGAPPPGTCSFLGPMFQRLCVLDIDGTTLCISSCGLCGGGTVSKVKGGGLE